MPDTPLIHLVVIKDTELERWLSGLEYLLQLQRTQAWFPAPTPGGSQPPVCNSIFLRSAASACLGSLGTHTHAHIHMQTHTPAHN